MNPIAAINAFTTALAFAGAVENDIPAIVSFVGQAVVAVEGSGKSGADKLTAVLNLAQVSLVTELPKLEDGAEALMADVAAFVNAVVAAYHDAGIWLHTLTGK